jgi:hypothetical protein
MRAWMSTRFCVLTLIILSGLTSPEAQADGYVDDDHTAMHGGAPSGTAKEPVSAAPAKNLGTGSGVGAGVGPGIESVSPERSSQALGHYARSRSLLLAALREFDQGYKIANPDALFDGRAWRADVITKAQELERVLDPQPRIGRTGVKYGADTRLLTDPVRGK